MLNEENKKFLHELLNRVLDGLNDGGDYKMTLGYNKSIAKAYVETRCENTIIGYTLWDVNGKEDIPSQEIRLQEILTKYADRDLIFAITRVIGKGYKFETLIDQGDLDGISEEERELIYELYEEAEENRTAFREKYKHVQLHHEY